ncbi:MAG: hypothetical protein H7A37_01810, partial [Chlamydiales bacterium]|nr:hypothetical protein [Chlamydiales bacterium]
GDLLGDNRSIPEDEAPDLESGKTEEQAQDSESLLERVCKLIDACNSGRFDNDIDPEDYADIFTNDIEDNDIEGYVDILTKKWLQLADHVINFKKRNRREEELNDLQEELIEKGKMLIDEQVAIRKKFEEASDISTSSELEDYADFLNEKVRQLADHVMNLEKLNQLEEELNEYEELIEMDEVLEEPSSELFLGASVGIAASAAAG